MTSRKKLETDIKKSWETREISQNRIRTRMKLALGFFLSHLFSNSSNPSYHPDVMENRLPRLIRSSRLTRDSFTTAITETGDKKMDVLWENWRQKDRRGKLEKRKKYANSSCSKPFSLDKCEI